MKMVRKSVGMLAVAVLATVTLAVAQGRGNGNGHGTGNPGRGHNKENHPGRGHQKDREDRDKVHDWDHHSGNHRNWDYNDHQYTHHDSRNHHHNHYRYVTYRHHRNGLPSWAPAYGYRYNTRYIYYRDYNLYYDCYRDVFVTWVNGRWTISTYIPRILIGVNFNTCSIAGVDYWADDFDNYLSRRRPSYVSIHASW